MSAVGHQPPAVDRRVMRFLAFGVAIVIVMGVLGARLAQLQLLQGTQYATLSTQNSRVDVAVPSSRGLITDRNGTALVVNVASYSVKIRPADLPLDQRDAVVARLASLVGADPTDIIATLDASSGSRFDPVRVARDVPETTARLIAESSAELPGVEVVVEPRRQYPEGPLVSQLIGYTGPIDPAALKDLKTKGYLSDDLVGRAGVEAEYESVLRGTYGVEEVERDAQGRKLQVLQTVTPAVAGDSLELSVDLKTQQNAQAALEWAFANSPIRSGVIVALNPQTGEVLAMVSLPTYDDNLFASGISNTDFQALLANPGKPLLNHAINEHFPPGSTYKLVTGTGALADRKITPTTKIATKGYLTIGTTRYYDWNHAGFGACDLHCGFGHSSDTYFYQLGGMLGIDRLGYWANQYGFGKQSGIDLPGEVSGIVPTNQWKQDTFGQDIFPGETYQAAIGQGYDVVTPLQLANAYATLANGGTVYTPQVVRRVLGPDGSVVRDFSPKVDHKMDLKPSVLTEMREASRYPMLLHHTYNLVDMPIVVGGKTGTAEFGVRDSKGRLPYHSWFAGFVPKDPWKKADDPAGLKAVGRTDSELAFVVFAFDTRTKGNAATEIAKKFLQLQYGISKDYTKPELLKQTNFYGQ